MIRRRQVLQHLLCNQRNQVTVRPRLILLEKMGCVPGKPKRGATYHERTPAVHVHKSVGTCGRSVPPTPSSADRGSLHD